MNLTMHKLLSKFLIICFGLIPPSVMGEESSNSDADTSFMLEINHRLDDAVSGSDFSRLIEPLSLAAREDMILNAMEAGNLPTFLRTLVPIETSMQIADSNYALTFFVMPDYLSIGSDDDYFLMPMTPILAQKVMDKFGGILPTQKMVDLIWTASDLKLTPDPIPPSAAMVSVMVFRDHNSLVQSARRNLLSDHTLGSLVAGHKKDVILSNHIAAKPDKVIIYGWHYPKGTPIQPVYSGHAIWYADYSHGIRVVLNKCILNENVTTLTEILTDPILFPLISDEDAAMTTTRYDTSRSNYPEN